MWLPLLGDMWRGSLALAALQSFSQGAADPRAGKQTWAVVSSRTG